MATFHWKSAVSGSWTNAANWTPSGGPQAQPSVTGSFSTDAAIFDTGSSHSYTVTTGGLSLSMLVSGDHVYLSNFYNGEGGYGGGILVNNDALVVLGKTSTLDYAQHDGYGGGPIEVGDAELLSYGVMGAGSVLIDDFGALVESGVASSLSSTGGVHVARGGFMGVFASAQYFGGNANTIDGRLTVSGKGSAASLVMASGSGLVQVFDHASMSVFAPLSGTLQFSVGTGAALSFTGSAGATNLVTFVGEGGTLTVNGGPAGTIAGFDPTDALVVGATVTKAVWTAAGGLKLFDGVTPVETLAVRGNYAGDVFSVAADGLYASRITLRVPPTLLPAPVTAISAALGNATLRAGVANLQTLAATVATQAAGMLPIVSSAFGVLPSAVTLPSAFDFTHTLSDGTTLSFVHPTP